jgi:hypothetical protein
MTYNHKTDVKPSEYELSIVQSNFEHFLDNSS